VTSPEPPPFVEVHQASSRVNADLIGVRLQEAGIPCVALGDDTAGLLGQAMVPRIMVPADVAGERADEIREIIVSVEGGQAPAPRSPYLVRMPAGCVIASVLAAALALAAISAIGLMAGRPSGYAWGGVGVAVAALLGWLGVRALAQSGRQRAAEASTDDAPPADDADETAEDEG
jgi:hypothetical protein